MSKLTSFTQTALLISAVMFNVDAKSLQAEDRGLILDLDADRGVTVEDGDRVSLWQNQVAGFPARDFGKRDEGRKEPGSGRPRLLKQVKELNGHNVLRFPQTGACLPG